ncbi:C-type lectin lectoxin-Phi1-like [Mya arenaria]|uniref:C-type lectin lectoxin-Phi1-like n=1 Tax=Mya arenaria TaxID=6604 RepID=UPI0022E1E304|nr:C-type lectin lectoxin-Phi1-like [Mya arenaria]
MALYRTCADINFRIACPEKCRDKVTSPWPSFVYVPALGKAYGATKTNKQVWQYALEFCFAYNGTLAVAKDALGSQVIKYVTETFNKVPLDDIHIGGASFGPQSGSWYFGDGTQVTEGYWEDGFPFNNAATSTCVHVRKGAYKHRNDNCNNNFGFICEVDPVVNES